jgi:hypothetical protein
MPEADSLIPLSIPFHPAVVLGIRRFAMLDIAVL